MTLLYIVLATVIVAALSLIGIVLLTIFKKQLSDSLLAFVALSAGTMLGGALLHLLPEAIEMSETGPISLTTMMLLVIGAFVASFLFEQFFSWHHCHGTNHCDTDNKPYAHLVIYSDAVHNFIDGLIIAAAFIVSPALGVTTTIAIALHEIPQELGDFAVLLHSGWNKLKAAVANSLAAFCVVIGGVVGFYLTSSVEAAVPVLLPIAAGSFLYIAAADLLPELRHEKHSSKIPLHILVFLTGLAIMIVTAFME